MWSSLGSLLRKQLKKAMFSWPLGEAQHLTESSVVFWLASGGIWWSFCQLIRSQEATAELLIRVWLDRDSLNQIGNENHYRLRVVMYAVEETRLVIGDAP